VLDDIINSEQPDVILVQEHWLTPHKLSNFKKYFTDYFSFGSSAMASCTESGFLRGRPFGGVMSLINKNLRKYTETICGEERFVIVKILDYLLIDIYLPCSGTADREDICADLLDVISTWRERFCDCRCIIGGDFNTNLDSNDPIATQLNYFCRDYSLTRCDDMFPSEKVNTYVNVSLNRESCIDYFLVSDDCYVTRFSVLDPEVNMSDHLPLLVTLAIPQPSGTSSPLAGNFDNKNSKSLKAVQKQLRWDKSDSISYYSYTGSHLQPIADAVNSTVLKFEANQISEDDVRLCIDTLYSSVVLVLQSAADAYVPK